MNASMPAHLGLVCITHSQEVRYRTITRKRLLQHDTAQQQALLRELYASNIDRLRAALDYCLREDIALYRLPSGIFPFFDDEAGRDVLPEFARELASLGARATENGIRLVMHPDQFVVLNSESENVVANSIKILQMHADIMDLLMQPRSPWALLEIHGGKSGRAQALIDCIRRLPEGIRSRLGLENDEYSYGADDIHAICMASSVPMVFDAHHHVVKEKLSSYEHPSVQAMLVKAQETWPDPAMQLVHISNGRESFNDRQHSDLIEVWPSSYSDVPWVEIEAKSKELAIQLLRQNGSGLRSAG